MRRVFLTIVAVLAISTPADARPATGPWASNRHCNRLIEVNRDDYRWIVVTDPDTWRTEPGFITGQASSRLAAWMWARAVANYVGGC